MYLSGGHLENVSHNVGINNRFKLQESKFWLNIKKKINGKHCLAKECGGGGGPSLSMKVYK